MQCRSPSPKLCAVLGAPFRCRGAHMVLAPISLMCGRFRERTGCISLTCGSWSRVRGFLPLQFQRLEADYRQASATRKRNRSRQATSSATRKRDARKIRRAGAEQPSEPQADLPGTVTCAPRPVRNSPQSPNTRRIGRYPACLWQIPWSRNRYFVCLWHRKPDMPGISVGIPTLIPGISANRCHKQAT